MKNTSKNGILFMFNLCLFFLIYRVSAADNSKYVPLESILLDCGTETEATDDRTWESNFGSKYAASDLSTSQSYEASQRNHSVANIPYMTARIFKSEFTYSFPVDAGWKYVRLHFYSSNYGNLSASNAIFSVSSGAYTLLRDFSVSQISEDLNIAVIVKEFSINSDKGALNITFTPSSNYTDSYALVNGIEVMSMPDIYNGSAVIAGAKGVSLIIDNTTVLEKVVRLNVGGKKISPAADTGLSRSWFEDVPYIYAGETDSANSSLAVKYLPGVPSYVAPDSIYRTARTMGPSPVVNQNYNLTWGFYVDPGFHYLVRLHFCEINSGITKVNQRVFQIFLNNQIVEDKADVVAWTGNAGNGIAMYKDYAVRIPKGEGKQFLWVELHPNIASKPKHYDAILNGLEIFKVNDTTGNLAGPNTIHDPDEQHMDTKSIAILTVVVGGAAAMYLLYIVVFVLFRRNRRGDSGAIVRPPLWLMRCLYSNSPLPVSGKTVGFHVLWPNIMDAP